MVVPVGLDEYTYSLLFTSWSLTLKKPTLESLLEAGLRQGRLIIGNRRYEQVSSPPMNIVVSPPYIAVCKHGPEPFEVQASFEVPEGGRSKYFPPIFTLS